MPTHRQPSKFPAADGWRHSLRWTGAAALLALAPKCFLCAAAYLGLGAVVGLNAPELCGASGTIAPTWATVGILICVVTVAGTVFAFMRRFRKAAVSQTRPSRKAYPRQFAQFAGNGSEVLGFSFPSRPTPRLQSSYKID